MPNGSTRALNSCRREVAFAYEQIEVVDAVLPHQLYAYWPIPREAAFPGLRLITPESPPTAQPPPPR